MSAEEIRSIGCGPIGAVASAIAASLLFRWQVKHWSRWIPTKVGEKGKKRLMEEYKTSNLNATILSIVGFFIGLLFYLTGWMTDRDWRGLGIGVGLMSILPLAYLVVANLSGGAENIKEAMVAFVIAQRTPPKVLFVIMGLFVIAGAISVVSLVFSPL